jgi:hypothetical protein
VLTTYVIFTIEQAKQIDFIRFQRRSNYEY